MWPMFIVMIVLLLLCLWRLVVLEAVVARLTPVVPRPQVITTHITSPREVTPPAPPAEYGIADFGEGNPEEGLVLYEVRVSETETAEELTQVMQHPTADELAVLGALDALERRVALADVATLKHAQKLLKIGSASRRSPADVVRAIGEAAEAIASRADCKPPDFVIDRRTCMDRAGLAQMLVKFVLNGRVSDEDPPSRPAIAPPAPGAA